jgi:hypothetical protein
VPPDPAEPLVPLVPVVPPEPVVPPDPLVPVVPPEPVELPPLSGVEDPEEVVDRLEAPTGLTELEVGVVLVVVS